VVLGHDPVCQSGFRRSERSERLMNGKRLKGECGVEEDTTEPTERYQVDATIRCHRWQKAAAELRVDDGKC